MQTVQPTRLLRHVLLADAIVSGLMGLLMVFDAAVLSNWFAIPAPWLRYAGLVLLPYAAIVGFLSTRSPMPRAVVMAVIVCNALWAVDCMLLLGTGWLSPTWLGSAFVLLQAWGVLLFACLQWVGLRRSPTQRNAMA
ncbi:hypothetical protein EM868_20290 [Cupriavidus gilardii]|uniref:hypothetical protein n=1 Tax=Cupriavidus gilardii TaxID=82541 RepID=UPI001571B4BF|nr:hypothetical protein [Cupriavidus gilardii]MCG5262906.1 hypothetical protein [Cupriavidus gilardii]MDF9432104.1 hypothetical protein [Cupriavidus gilardii]NSX06136.1 hypothetical protein [Cupriavidus gilardii]